MQPLNERTSWQVVLTEQAEAFMLCISYDFCNATQNSSKQSKVPEPVPALTGDGAGDAM